MQQSSTTNLIRVIFGDKTDNISIYRDSAVPYLQSKSLFNRSTSNINFRVVKDSLTISFFWQWRDSIYWNPLGNFEISKKSTLREANLKLIQTGTAAVGKWNIQMLKPIPNQRDTTGPTLKRAQIASNRKIHLEFNEAIKLHATRIQSHLNSHILSIFQLNEKSAYIESSIDWPCNDTFYITILNITDTLNNPTLTITIPLLYPCIQEIQLGEIVVSEIMHNPGSYTFWLPPIKYVEIVNQSSHGLWLTNSKICDAVSCAKLPDYWLLPNKSILLYDESDTQRVSKPFKSMGLPITNLPNFNTLEDSIILYNSSGSAFYRNRYRQEYHQTPFVGGGYSLERAYPTTANSHWLNWQSNRFHGGSPGYIDTCPIQPVPPSVSWLYALVNPKTKELFLPSTQPIEMELIKRMLFMIITDSNDSIIFSPNLIEVTSNYSLWQCHDSILTYLSAPNHLVIGSYKWHYRVPCFDTLEIIDELRIITAEKNDLMITEIQFDADAQDLDFIEIYNPTEFPIDLSSLAIRYYHDDSTPAWQLPFTAPHRILPSKHCLLLCKDAETIRLNHPDLPMNTAMENGLFQGLYADFGLLELFNFQVFKTIHLAGYNSNWHNPNLTNSKGISLERVGTFSDAVQPWNWHSHSDYFLKNSKPLPCNQGQNKQKQPIIQSQNCSPGIVKEWKIMDSKSQFKLNRQLINPYGNHNYLCLEYQLPMPDCLIQIKLLSTSGGLLSVPVARDLIAFTGCLCFPPSTTNKLPKGAYLLSVKCLLPTGETLHKLLPFSIL